jgi:ribose-phosphate pyrophosphokinase
MVTKPPIVFAIGASRTFGMAIANQLGIELALHEEREFEDGEHKIRPLMNVRGRSVFVIHSLYSDPNQSANDKLIRLMFLTGALKDASASRVTLVIPYLAYARKDRRSQPRDPVSIRYVAQILESVGADHVVTIDVHNLAAYQNAFRIPADHLDSVKVFIEHLVRLRDSDALAILSPDIGGVKRAEHFRDALERATGRVIPLGFMEKARTKGVLTPGRISGDVTDRTVIIFDDMISTGGTLAHAAAACKSLGASRVLAAATHGLFTSRANDALSTQNIDQIIVTDSVPADRLDPHLAATKLTVLPLAGLFAETIKRLHSGGSLVELLDV